jgi:hypothetical protein
LYGPNKYKDLVNAVGTDRVLCVYDDLPEMCEQAMRLDLTAILRAQPYNRHWGYPSHIGSGRLYEASSVGEYRELFDAMLYEWRVHHGE